MRAAPRQDGAHGHHHYRHKALSDVCEEAA